MDPTMIHLPNLGCMILIRVSVTVCGKAAEFLLIEADGQYTPVCAEHIATDEEGRILPRIAEQEGD
ncbi:hypothetical protein LCGC14_2712750 [marine sediment metagenome]|uniref:Uncharacterized protein n=1 Tax=marine sediment metagenome TaxID=412755 RepID=A0A0F9A054_9ZZZZ